MPHHTPLIATLVGGLVLAFILGALAHRMRISPLVGYLLAGVLVGPTTPGFVADPALAADLAEIGVILLMFGVGLHFSLADLLSVRFIAVPGALVQIAFATALGMGLAWGLGWSLGGDLVFGLALSVASTVVLLRALQERRLVETEQGRIAVGWLIVEDLAMVLTLVLLPPVAGLLGGTAETGTAAGSGEIARTLGITFAKVAAFVALMLLIGRQVIPRILHYVAHTGSRELFRLAVLSLALGVAYGAAELFGVSFALGAFFAGMVLAESELSHRAAEESLPLRDAFAVLFFVSVGMLFDPTIFLRAAGPLIAALLIVTLGKSAAALLIVLAFRHPLRTALTISASLAQIGEFSFILAGLGVSLGLLPQEGRDLILAVAILSILLNPLFFAALDRLGPWLERRVETPLPQAAPTDLPTTNLKDHMVLVGFGRVGSRVGEELERERLRFLVIEDRNDLVEVLRTRGIEAIQGNAAAPEVIRAANLAEARSLLIAIPDGYEGGQIVEQGRAANPDIDIIARAHSDEEVEHLRRYGADLVIMGEHEIAHRMAERALGRQRATPEPDRARVPP
ncbi:MAG TPA: YbaL family putative K(+) efflux transporter [Stellaceae bacterium]